MVTFSCRRCICSLSRESEVEKNLMELNIAVFLTFKEKTMIFITEKKIVELLYVVLYYTALGLVSVVIGGLLLFRCLVASE